MAYYEGVFSCGHDGRVNIIGPSKDREWKKKSAFSGLCPECYKKAQEEKRAVANKEAAEKSAEMELPELAGTEKQVAWANTLRLNIYTALDVKVSAVVKRMQEKEIDIFPNSDITIQEWLTAFDWFMQSKIEAKYWIEIRQKGVTPAQVVSEYRAYNDAEANKEPEESKNPEESKEQLSVTAANASDIKSGVVEIEYNAEKKCLYARYIKDTDFISIVKELGYQWGGVWHKDINEYTGTMEDRAAELGNKLLNSGFKVQFPNIQSKEKAISADFVPENDRWVKFNTKTGKLALTWEKRSDALYEAAKKLPSAKWSSGNMKVNIEFYQEVLDFAETMGFSISQTAMGKIVEYKQKESGFDIANVAVKNKENVSDEERLEKSLKSGGTILEDLRDDS